MNEDFLNQIIKTHNLSEGQPKHIVPVGQGVLFLRSNRNSVLDLWILDVRGREEVLIEAEKIGNNGFLTDAEKLRRERLRMVGGGITSFDVDKFGKNIVFILAGKVYVYNLQSSNIFYLKKVKDAFDPRISPDGKKIAYSQNGNLFVVNVDENASPKIIAEGSKDVFWGMADFIAAEEMDRYRGFWWAPNSLKILVARVDQRKVNTWQISDPANPESGPSEVKYPQAGSKNTRTDIFVFDLKDGTKHEVLYSEKYEYIARLSWNDSLPIVALQDRSQRILDIYRINEDYQLEQLESLKSESWVELTPGLPAIASGKLISAAEAELRNLTVASKVIASELHLRAVHGVLKNEIIFSAWLKGDARSWHIFRVDFAGKIKQLSSGSGVHSAFVGEEFLVISEQNLQSKAKIKVFKKVKLNWEEFAEIKNLSEDPIIAPDVKFIKSKKLKLDIAVILPKNAKMSQKLPILMMPYGGPHAQMVVEAQNAFLTEQWWANQGFAVVVADGRGAPGRNIAWEKSIKNQLLSIPLQDQIEALNTACQEFKQLDRSRVGIVGWSFGGFLSAAAVLKHPKVFKAAIAGAPVTDWRLYDTHYTERYLGDPNKEAKNYDKNSLLDMAPNLSNPLLLIHGMADDNVVVAHSLRLSAELFKHGKIHQFLPITGATHMASGAETAKNLLKIQLKFFRGNL